MAIKEVAESAKKSGELAKKIERAERQVKRKVETVNKLVEQGKPIGTRHIDLKYKAKELEQLSKDFNRQKKKIER